MGVQAGVGTRPYGLGQVGADAHIGPSDRANKKRPCLLRDKGAHLCGTTLIVPGRPEPLDSR